MTIVLLADARDAGVRRLAAMLTAAGFEVATLARPEEARLTASARGADAVVFDPQFADFDLVTRPQGRLAAQAHIAWTAGHSSLGAARLLEQGADEVVHGGMSPEELAARVRKAVARTGRLVSGELELGPLRLDAGEGEVTWRGKEVALSRREREVLHVLAESPGRTVRREQLYRRVWGYTMARGDRTVDVNVKRLRDKLAAAGAGVAIETRPGIGYRLDLVTDAPAPRSRAPAPVAAGRPEA